MVMTKTDAQKLIHELDVIFPDGKVEVVGHTCVKKLPAGVTPADMYDLRLVADMDVKKIPLADLNALIAYGDQYIRDYRLGVLLFNLYKKTRGLSLANFDGVEQEQIAFKEIQNSVCVLKSEAKRRL